MGSAERSPCFEALRQGPFDPPTRLGLVINRRTPRALGVTISPPMLVRADQLID